ncbi:MAG: response regulator, partial [Planctomycetes bacterium]|nr:response regulator [Planctomycetota bacterium]
MTERRRVLVVDDNRDTTDLLCQSLEEHGYTAIPAYDGVEAMRKARNDVFDCVLLDIMMPEHSGLQVCHELKRQEATKHLPIVILSAKRDPKDISYARQMGASEYLTKPVKLRKLLEALEKHSLRNRPAATIGSGQAILFVGDDQDLAKGTQRILDASRVGGSEWLRIVPAVN